MNEHSFTPAMVADALLSFAEEELEWGSYGEYINSIDSVVGQQYNVPGLGSVTIVDYHSYDSDKNYDSWAEQLWIVFNVHGTLYKATGTYTSYTGSEWDEELKLVVPREKIITFYEEA